MSNKYQPYHSHEYVKNLGFKELRGRGFCVLVHGENISTTWNIPFKGEEIIDKTKKQEIFEGFGIADTEPLQIKKRPMLILRDICNHLPFNRLLFKVAKKIYYK